MRGCLDLIPESAQGVLERVEPTIGVVYARLVLLSHTSLQGETAVRMEPNFQTYPLLDLLAELAVKRGQLIGQAVILCVLLP